MLASTFMTLIIMILSFKISEGIAFGFMTYALLMAVSKRRKEVHYMVYALGIFFVVHLLIYYIWIV
jgi:AGZA family xanthine/uracil permease-like MFS transporter